MHLSRDTHGASADNNSDVGRGDRGGPRGADKASAAGMRSNCFTVSVQAVASSLRWSSELEKKTAQGSLEQMDADSIRGGGLGPSRVSCDVSVWNCVAELRLRSSGGVDDG